MWRLAGDQANNSLDHFYEKASSSRGRGLLSWSHRLRGTSIRGGQELPQRPHYYSTLTKLTLALLSKLVKHVYQGGGC